MLTGCHSANAIAGGLLGQVKSLELASVRNDEFDTTILMRVLCSILCQARSLGRGIGEADRMGIEQIDNRSVADVADDEEIRVESFALPCVRVRDAERPFLRSWLRSQATKPSLPISSVSTWVSQVLKVAGYLPSSSRYR